MDAKRAASKQIKRPTSRKRVRTRSSNTIAFGAVLREYRLEQEMTQEQLAWNSGVDRKFIGALERGLKEPCLETIIKLTHILEIPLGEFMAAVEKQAKRKPVITRAS